jgi:hypothetical protein
MAEIGIGAHHFKANHGLQQSGDLLITTSWSATMSASHCCTRLDFAGSR